MGDVEAPTVGGASDTAARVAEAVRAAMDALPAQQQAATLDAEMAQPPTEPASGSPVQDAAAGQSTHLCSPSECASKQA